MMSTPNAIRNHLVQLWAEAAFGDREHLVFAAMAGAAHALADVLDADLTANRALDADCSQQNRHEDAISHESYDRGCQRGYERGLAEGYKQAKAEAAKGQRSKEHAS